VKLSVCVITLNEEANIGRTLKSVQQLVSDGQGEIIVVDSGSTDKTVEIAKSYGAKVFTEPWKGFAAQKNSALEKAQGQWILSLDADEEITPTVVEELGSEKFWKDPWLGLFYDGFTIPRKNYFLNRWIQHGGFFPDSKLRLFRKGKAYFKPALVHETPTLDGKSFDLGGTFDYRFSLLHHAYPTLSGYIEHMNKYSSLGAEMEIEKGRRGFSFINIVIRPWLTFIYNYFFRLGFLDGKEGLLLHIYHAVYVSWKYAKVWELSRTEAGSKKNAAS
jgi:glycosyltransferase involved in cell wall biosynthesis